MADGGWGSGTWGQAGWGDSVVDRSVAETATGTDAVSSLATFKPSVTELNRMEAKLPDYRKWYYIECLESADTGDDVEHLGTQLIVTAVTG